MIKISACQRQLPYVLNSVLFSGNRDASLNWFLFNYSCNTISVLQTCIYILSFNRNHVEENMWLITSEKICSFQTNTSGNEPPSLLSWHKLRISAVPITQLAGSQELSSKPLHDFYCSFFSCFSSNPQLCYCPALVYHGFQV